MKCILFYPKYEKMMILSRVTEFVSYCILSEGRYLTVDGSCSWNLCYISDGYTYSSTEKHPYYGICLIKGRR